MKKSKFHLSSFSIGTALLFFLASPSLSASSGPKVLKAVTWTALSDSVSPMIAFDHFVKRVNERAEGKLKIEYIGGQEVMPAGEQMRGLSKGIFDVLITPGYHTPIVPEIDVPLLADNISPAQQRKIGLFDLLVKLHKERLGVIPLAKVDQGSGYYLYSNKKIRTLEDFKGLKFRSNRNYEAFLRKLGINTVNLPSGEIYTAMQRGLIVGYPQIPFISFRGLQEVTRYVVDHRWWSGGHTYIYINNKVFSGLSPDLQKLITDVGIEVENESVGICQKLLDEERKRLLAAHMEFIKLSPAEGHKLVQLAADAKWAEILKEAPKYGPEMKAMVTKANEAGATF